MTDISMRQMLQAGVHFGHQARYWNPKMAPYIFGVRHQVHIINLETSLPLFRDALQFISSLAAKGGKLLFVGTKPSAQQIIREEAQRCGMPYVDYRWLGGMLTNYKTIRQRIKRLKDLEAMEADGRFKRLTKKEGLILHREMQKLEHGLGGIKNMGGLPDALFIIDVGHEKNAVAEAKRLGIPIVGVVDTNCNPDKIDYLIPGNDDAIRAIQLYISTIADTILTARASAIEAGLLSAPAQEKLEEEDAKKVAVKKRVFTKKTKDTDAVADSGETQTAKTDREDNTSKSDKSPGNALAKRTFVKKAEPKAGTEETKQQTVKKSPSNSAVRTASTGTNKNSSTKAAKPKAASEQKPTNSN